MDPTERDRLVILEQKIDMVLDKMSQFTEKTKDHESRIRCLESRPAKRWEAVVAALVTGVVGAGIGALITFLAQK